MNLHVESNIYAIIKSSDIKISSAMPQNTQNINILEVVIETIEANEENTEVALRIDSKTLLVTLLQNKNIDVFSVGDKAYASIDYNSIIIGL